MAFQKILIHDVTQLIPAFFHTMQTQTIRLLRAKVDTIRADLLPATQEAYDAATTYHDGKWLLLRVSSKSVIRDAQRLLAVKRRISKEKA